MFIIVFPSYTASGGRDTSYVGPFATEREAESFLEANGYVRRRAGWDLNWWRAPWHIDTFAPPPVDAEVVRVTPSEEECRRIQAEAKFAADLSGDPYE